MNLQSKQRPVSASDLSGDPRWQLVQRIAQSDRFAKTARLRDFLLYVCQATLEGRLDEVTEQHIGERVFGRSLNYNPSEDNIVRSHARLLRQRLQAYFEDQAAGEPLVLRIPKGRYIPEWFDAASCAEAEPPLPTSRRPGSNRLVNVLLVAIAILATTVLALVWVLTRPALTRPKEVTAATRPTAATPALNSLWSQLFSDKWSTTIVLPDNTFALIQEGSRKNLNLQAYLKRYTPPNSGTLRTFPGFLFTEFYDRRYTTFDAASTALRVFQIGEKLQGHLIVRYARDVTLRDLSPGHLILIGRSVTNPWMEIFEPKQNFVGHVDFTTDRTFWSNAAPQPGEQHEYVPSRNGNRLDAYGSVAFLPNLSGGNVLIIDGTGSSSQEGSAEFVTNEMLLSSLTEKIGQNHAGLPYFDALLRTTTINEVAQQPLLVAYRIIR